LFFCRLPELEHGKNALRRTPWRAMNRRRDELTTPPGQHLEGSTVASINGAKGSHPASRLRGKNRRSRLSYTFLPTLTPTLRCSPPQTTARLAEPTQAFRDAARASLAESAATGARPPLWPVLERVWLGFRENSPASKRAPPHSRRSLPGIDRPARHHELTTATWCRRRTI